MKNDKITDLIGDIGLIDYNLLLTFAVIMSKAKDLTPVEHIIVDLVNETIREVESK